MDPQFSQDQTRDQQKEEQHVKKKLHHSLKKLQEQEIKGSQGLSDLFQTRLGKSNNRSAISQCEQAIETLSNEYVSQLQLFQQIGDIEKLIKILDESENIWKRNVAVIRKYDQHREEERFFSDLREQTLSILEMKLSNVSMKCAMEPSAKNVALCIAILSVMDSIFEEQGKDSNHAQRRHLREMAKQFR